MAMLDSVRVLDLSRVIAGPFCSRMLSDLGAEVIKVESPAGEATRQAAPAKGGFSSLFAQYNAGKYSVSINLRDPRGIDLVLELAAESDVFLENFRAGLIDEMGLGYARVRESAPSIVYCSISGFGQQGRDAGRPAYTDIIQAESGFDYAAQKMYGNDAGSPPGAPVALADTCTSLNATIAILAALYHRQVTGEGRYIDLSMLDAMVAANDSTLQRYLFSGADPNPPNAIYRAPLELKDGYMAASIGLSFEKTMRAIGRTDLLEDERFATPALRRANMPIFIEITKVWALDRSVAEVAGLFEEHDIPFGRVATTAEVLENRTLIERGMIVDVDLPGAEPLPVLNTPFNFSGEKTRPRGAPPQLGEHTRAMLSSILDMPDERYRQLRQDGVIFEGGQTP